MALLAYSSFVRSELIQAIVFIVSMVLIWYASHPLSHYISAKILGVRTLYFYIGTTEMRSLDYPISKILDKYFITIGTKLETQKLKSLSRGRRSFVFGAGTIVSTWVAALTLGCAVVLGFSLAALLLGSLFFFGTLATELLFSTKAGDLAKMNRELRKNSIS